MVAVEPMASKTNDPAAHADDIVSRRGEVSASLAHACSRIKDVLTYSSAYLVFIAMVEARSGQCRITPSTGFPVYLNYMVVPLGFLFGGIQFFLAGVRNLISPDNYLSWYQKDEYEEDGVDPGMSADDLEVYETDDEEGRNRG